MFASKFVFAMLVVMLGAGCTTFDPNRSFPEQPVVSEKISVELTGKKLTDFQLYVNEEIVYYNIGNIRKNSAKNIMAGKNEVIRFTQEFPKTSIPSHEELATGEKFIEFFKKWLHENGFNVAKQECKSCLTINFDFARYEEKFKDEGKTLKYWYSKPTLLYKGTRVMVAREDRLTWSVVNSLKPKDIISDGPANLVAKGAFEEIVQAWDKFFAKTK